MKPKLRLNKLVGTLFNQKFKFTKNLQSDSQLSASQQHQLQARTTQQHSTDTTYNHKFEGISIFLEIDDSPSLSLNIARK